MKKLIYIIAAASIVSCANDQDNNLFPAPEHVTATITIGTDNSFANIDPGNRETSRADISDPLFWTENSIRYIAEVWTDGQTPERVYRHAEIRPDLSSGPSFDIRLVPGNYHFLFWADMVPAGQTDAEIDNHYLTTDGLRLVSVKNHAYTGSDDSRDAFCYSVSEYFDSGFSLVAILARPLAKIILSNKDVNFTNAQTVNLTFTGLCDSYDVLTGTAASVRVIAPQYPDVVPGQRLVAWDYLFVPSTGPDMIANVGAVNKNVDNINLTSNTRTWIKANFGI